MIEREHLTGEVRWDLPPAVADEGVVAELDSFARFPSGVGFELLARDALDGVLDLRAGLDCALDLVGVRWGCGVVWGFFLSTDFLPRCCCCFFGVDKGVAVGE